MFPIKYIDNNLVWNKDNEVFAYYELIPYNYSFLSAEQKFIVHDSFRQLIAQSREGKIHALQIATESSIRSMQEQSKKLVTGKLKEVACQKIDEQTEALVSMIGDNQVDYRFFLGFKLMVTEEQLNLKNIKKSAWLTFTEFLHEVNHTLMNDFVSMPNDEINRYMKMEKLLENKISRRFKVRRLEINDFGYLMEHLYGRDGIAYEDYEYQLPKKKLQKETLIKYYDLIRPTRCVIEESQRYLRLEHEDKESYVSYFTVNAIVGELDFPSSEIFYFQQQQFTFPVDTSMNVEIVENGVHYMVDVVNGQKTGFFLDQKYNRLAMQRICKGKKVLDCFTHMGTFALNAGIAGAAEVTGLDISEYAVEQARENARRNGLEDTVQFRCANVLDELPRLAAVGEKYDVVILDPPAFTKSREATKNAIKGYREINMKGLKLVKDGGYLATCSCSHFMTQELLAKTVKEAAKATHKRLRQVEFRTQAPDHPILWANSANVPESYYLKFFIFQVVDEK